LPESVMKVGRGRFRERKRWQQGCLGVQRHEGN